MTITNYTLEELNQIARASFENNDKYRLMPEYGFWFWDWLLGNIVLNIDPVINSYYYQIKSTNKYYFLNEKVYIPTQRILVENYSYELDKEYKYDWRNQYPYSIFLTVFKFGTLFSKLSSIEYIKYFILNRLLGKKNTNNNLSQDEINTIAATIIKRRN